MNYFGDSDIPTLMAEFGRPVTIGEVAGVGIPDLKDEAFATSDRPDRGAVVLSVSTVTIQTSAFPNCAIDDLVLLEGQVYSVRERLRKGDGALTEILLGEQMLIKTKRVTHTVTSGDITAIYVNIDVPWDVPFADANYTCDENVEAVDPADAQLYYVNGFSKAADKVTVNVYMGTGVVGDVIVVHAIGIHD